MALENSLKILQADIVATYFQAHGNHWNVEGMLFPEMHAKWLEIYEDVYESIDLVSEMLRKIGSNAPFTLEQFVSNKTISDIHIGNNANHLIESFLESNDKVIADLEAAHKEAENSGEIGIASDLEIRHSMHKKWKWQLTSTLKTQVM